jgi:hypothetical protein
MYQKTNNYFFCVAVGVITSNENKAKNNMKIIDNILGVQ